MNFYSLSGLLIAFTSGLMTMLMLFLARKKLHYVWAIFCFSVFLFGLGIFFVGGAVSPDIAEFWWRVSHIGAILIPVLFLHFVYEFLEIKKSIVLFVIYAISFLLLISNFVDGLFIDNMRFVFDQFYYDSPPSLLYILFTAMFFGLTAYSHFLLWKGYKETKDIVIKNKIKFFYFGTVAGFAGGSFNFLPVYGIDVYPYLNIMVCLYPLIITYAIFKHQLFDIKLVLVEFAILLLNLFLLINAFASYGSSLFVIDVPIFIFVAILSILLMRAINKDIRDREKIVKLIDDVKVANELLRINEAQKTEFVSIASHQLRAPLTAIKGYASMILEGTFGQLLPDAREAMGKLYKSNEKVLSIVEDLLTVSRIEQGRMVFNLEMVNLSNFVNTELAEIRNDAKDAGIIVHFRPDSHTNPLVSIDTKKFKQVVRHILENAIQYTKSGGSVRVEVQNDSVAGKARLLVSDTGAGMTSEQISSIFERSKLKLEPVDGTNTEIQNGLAIKNSALGEEAEETKKNTSGIGLYIVQEIIEAHHGILQIESSGLNRGTTVTVELPVTEEYK